MIRYAKIDLAVDTTGLQQQVAALGDGWKPHFNTMYYEGEWTVLPLRVAGGRMDQIAADLMGNEEYMDTALMPSFPSVQALLQQLHCPILSVRFLNLKSGAVIKPHRDHELSFENGEARLHFPVFTNDQVAFFIEDERVQMRAGECWYINANLMHSVANPSPADRIHLVVDCVVNDWLKELFEGAYKSYVPKEASRAQLLRVIAELKTQDTDIARQLIAQLEREVGSGESQ